MKNNQAKFDYIVSHWELRDGVIYSKRTGKPLVSSATNASGRHRYRFKINGKKIYMYIHDAIWTLYNNRPMPDGWFVIHHIDLNPANNAPDNLILMSHRMHRSYHHYINGGKGYTYTTAASCRLNPWQAQVSLPIRRRITKHFATEAEAAAFVAYHRAPIIKAFQAMGLPLPQTNDESTPQASRTIPPVRQSEMR